MGSKPNILAVSAAKIAMYPNSLYFGLILMEVSAKKIGPLLVIIKLVAATLLTPSLFPITFKIGFITSG